MALKCDAQSKLVMVNKPSDYLPTIEHALNESLVERPRLVIYNAGMDPFECCSNGGMAGITEEILRERERMVFEVYHAGVFRSHLPWQGCYVGWSLPQKSLVDD